MSDLLPFLVIGLVNGSLYGLAGVGLVLTYKTSGVFNFAHGAVAAVAAYAMYSLHVVHGLPAWLSVVLAVLVAAPMAGLGLEFVARNLARGGTSSKVIATVGVQVGLTGLLVALYGSSALEFPAFLPMETVDLGGVSVTIGQLISVGIALLGVVGLSMFFRLSTLGVQMRAVVDDPALLEMTGTSAKAVRRAAWIVGSGLAGVAGVLLAPTLGLDASLLTLLVVQAFGAAAIGTFSSLPMTYIGGLVLGVGAALVTKYAGSSALLLGLSPSLPFLLLFVVLLVVPRRRLVEGGTGRDAPPSALRLPRSVQVPLVSALLVIGVLVPAFAGSRLGVFTQVLVFIVIFHSLNLLARTAGLISLCQAAFVGVGAAVFAHLAVGSGLPWALAVLLAGLVAVPVGALVSVPAIRLSGVFLALATFGLGLLAASLAFKSELLFGAGGSLMTRRPAGFESDRAYYYLCMGLALATCVFVALILRTRSGRLLRAMSDSPLTLSTVGLTVNVTRVAVFCLSAFLAAVAGAFYAALGESVSSLGFNAFVSLTWLAVLGLSGRGQQSAPVIAAVSLILLPSYISDATINNYLPVLFGVGAVVAALSEARASSTTAPPGSAEPGSGRTAARLRVPAAVPPRVPLEVGR